jgi:hypothetical protein
MVYLLAALILLSIVHFAYESIIAPSLRLSLRYKLFALRDEVRELKMVYGSSLADRHFHYVQDSLNALLSVLYRFDLAALMALEHELKHNTELRKRVEVRAVGLDDCAIAEVKLIREKTFRIAVQALIVNNGFWAVCAVPVLAASWGVAKLKRLIRESVSLSESDIQRAIPPSTAANSLL